jgi:hypothetical protein
MSKMTPTIRTNCLIDYVEIDRLIEKLMIQLPNDNQDKTKFLAKLLLIKRSLYDVRDNHLAIIKNSYL